MIVTENFMMIMKSAERGIKIFITLFFIFLMLLEYSCENGGRYSVMKEKQLVEDMFKEKKIECEIAAKEMSWLEEPIDVSFWKVFILGYHGMYRVYDVLYTNELGRKNKFITYKFPFTYGLDVPVEETSLLFEETRDAIKIYYDKEPVGGFVVENNPFSKKILFEQKSNFNDIVRTDEACYY